MDNTQHCSHDTGHVFFFCLQVEMIPSSYLFLNKLLNKFAVSFLHIISITSEWSNSFATNSKWTKWTIYK